MCQAKEEQENGQGALRGEEVCQAQTDLEQDASPAPGCVPNSRDGPVPEELNLSNRQPSLVPSSEEGYGVTVSRMCEAKVNGMTNLDGMRRKVCVAQLSLSNMCNVTEQDVPSSRNLRNTGIAKSVTGKFANTKPEDIQS